MRQAGRYLPEFRELLTKYSFFEVCQTPSLAMEVTLMPIKRFDLDAAIIFSDILVVPQAMGMEVELIPGRGMLIKNPLKVPEDVDRLIYPLNVYEKIKYVFDAITLTRQNLHGKVPLLGFSGAPWTLMCFMIEGGSSMTQSKAKYWLYKYPDATKKLLDMLTTVIVDYLVGQIEAGAQMVQLFETLAEYQIASRLTFFGGIASQVWRDEVVNCVPCSRNKIVNCVPCFCSPQCGANYIFRLT